MTEKGNGRSVLDLDEALDIAGGDPEMLVAVAQVFLDEGPGQIKAVEQNIADHHAMGIQRAAHNLKGSFVVFGAHRAAEAALAVEHAACDPALSSVPQKWAALQQEMDLVIDELQRLCDS